jgi:poly(A) polymerase
MRVAGEWLAHPGTQAVLGLLSRAGHQALAVGGCVRDAVLGVPVGDVDIATDAVPARVMALAKAARIRAVPTGIAHGTVTLVAGGRTLEVTTFRRDVETDGRRAVVAFAREVAADAARRDFTMNALYATAEGAVVDPLGGLPDLLARRVRFVGEPAARIREDFLRILRFFRFQAWYGGGDIDAEGLAACAALAGGIDGLSRERVGAEMRKLLSAPDPAPAVAAMAAAGVLARVLPGAEPRGLAPLVHLEGPRPPRWLRRLTVLGGGEAEALRLSRAEAKGLAARLAGAAGGEGPGVLGYRLGAEAAEDALLARAALAGEALPEGWEARVARGAAAVLPVSAADLMPILAGPALGAAMKAVEARWILSDFRLTKADLVAWAKRGGGSA